MITWFVGPDWKGDKPAHIKQVFHSTTPFSIVIVRTQLFNPVDMPNVVAVLIDESLSVAAVRAWTELAYEADFSARLRAGPNGV